MNMDIGASIKGRGRGITKRRDDIHGHPGAPTRSRGIDPASVQKAILRTMGSMDTPPKGPRASSRLTKFPKKGDSTAGGLDQIRIYGLKESKAASNTGGGVKELLDFLERKATPPNSTSKDTLRISKVCLYIIIRGSPSSSQPRPIWSALVSCQALRTTTEIYEPRRDRYQRNL